MSSKIGYLSPSSVAQDWTDRAIPKGNFSSSTFPYPRDVCDHAMTSLQRLKEPSLNANEENFSPPSIQRDIRSSPVTTATQMSDNNVSKCRQLPCKTFVSTGSCPYGDRCVFLHDPCIVSKPVFIKIKRKTKDDIVADTFFWPTIPVNPAQGQQDSKNNMSQSYFVPSPTYPNEYNSINDAAVHSMWEHFVDFLATDPLSVVTKPRVVPPLNCYQTLNPYSRRQRLPVFMALSQGRSMASSHLGLYS